MKKELIILPSNNFRRGSICTVGNSDQLEIADSFKRHFADLSCEIFNLYIIGEETWTKQDQPYFDTHEKIIKIAKGHYQSPRVRNIIATTDKTDLGLHFPKIPSYFVDYYIEKTNSGIKIETADIQYEEVYKEPKGIHSNRGEFVSTLRIVEYNTVVILFDNEVKTYTQQEVDLLLKNATENCYSEEKVKEAYGDGYNLAMIHEGSMKAYKLGFDNWEEWREKYLNK